MSQSVTKEKLKGDIEGAKAEKFDELQDQFINGELTEEEFEEELDTLFESGEDFLDHEPETEPMVDTDDAKFRLKEIGQIIALITVLYGVYITKGIIIPFLLIGAVMYFVYKLQ